MIRIGTAGNPDEFYESGKKSSFQMPEYLKEKGLNAYEYQCGKGVKITLPTAEKIGTAAKENDIAMSLHSPYFISLSSVEEEKRIKSVDYIMQSLNAAKMLGAKRVVVHSGSCAKISREEALSLAKNTLTMALEEQKSNGFEDIFICPETMGKVNQLGTVDEVLEMCTLSERLIPCIDFGHINAREFGSLNAFEDFKNITDKIHNKLGEERGRKFHVHFSRIEFTVPGGEKRHIPYSDTSFGPAFDPFAELIAKKNLEPFIICESPGTQGIDACVYQTLIEDAKNA